MQSSKEKKIPTEKQALEAVKTLILWIGDDPEREGLLKTPARFLKALKEYGEGYIVDPTELLKTTFEEVEKYNDIVVLAGIPFQSTCEHHLAPIEGLCHVAYIPDHRIVGISKLAKVVDVFARRLQIQEKATAQIAQVIEKTLKPLGVFVVIDAQHFCMSHRGIRKQGTQLITKYATGKFLTEEKYRQEVTERVKIFKK